MRLFIILEDRAQWSRAGRAAQRLSEFLSVWRRGNRALCAPLVSVEQYLHTSYRPDCDYIDGVVVERNLGQYDHSKLQNLVLLALSLREAEWGVVALPELRLRVRERKYRVPDVMVLPAGERHPPVIEKAPLLCIEIVSPDDRLNDLTERAQDYVILGVPETWILDPETRKAYVYSTNGLHEVGPNTVMRCGKIELDLVGLFARMD
jgi:Uma2 family endonuclease